MTRTSSHLMLGEGIRETTEVQTGQYHVEVGAMGRGHGGGGDVWERLSTDGGTESGRLYYFRQL